MQKFSEEMPDHWALGDRVGGYLCTNIAIRAIFHVMMDICDYVSEKNGVDLSVWSSKEVTDEIIKYIDPVIHFFKNADSDQIKSFRNIGSSLAAVKKQSMGMNVFISKEFLDFSPEGLKDYINSRDEKGNETAVLLVNRIQDRIFHYVIDVLKEHFGEENDKWWTEGVPYNVRRSCTDEWEKQKRQDPCESYLYLLNYQDIAMANWGLLDKCFSLGEKDIGNRKKCIAWVKKLNVIRNKTHHPEKGKLTPEQIKYVEEIFAKVEQYIPVQGEVKV